MVRVYCDEHTIQSCSYFCCSYAGTCPACSSDCKARSEGWFDRPTTYSYLCPSSNGSSYSSSSGSSVSIGFQLSPVALINIIVWSVVALALIIFCVVRKCKQNAEAERQAHYHQPVPQRQGNAEYGLQPEPNQVIQIGIIPSQQPYQQPYQQPAQPYPQAYPQAYPQQPYPQAYPQIYPPQQYPQAYPQAYPPQAYPQAYPPQPQPYPQAYPPQPYPQAYPQAYSQAYIQGYPEYSQPQTYAKPQNPVIIVQQ